MVGVAVCVQMFLFKSVPSCQRNIFVNENFVWIIFNETNIEDLNSWKEGIEVNISQQNQERIEVNMSLNMS